MDEDQDRMYVGCKDHVLSVDINNITHGTLKVRGHPARGVFANFCNLEALAAVRAALGSLENAPSSLAVIDGHE